MEDLRLPLNSASAATVSIFLEGSIVAYDDNPVHGLWAVPERPAEPLPVLLPERLAPFLPIDQSSLTDCPDHMDVGALRDGDLD